MSLRRRSSRVLKSKPFYYFLHLGLVSLIISFLLNNSFIAKNYITDKELSVDINIHDTYFVIYHHHLYLIFFIIFFYNFLVYTIINYFNGKLLEFPLKIKVISSAIIFFTLTYVLYSDYNYVLTKDDLWSNNDLDYNLYIILLLTIFVFLLLVVPALSILVAFIDKIKSSINR